MAAPTASKWLEVFNQRYQACREALSGPQDQGVVAFAIDASRVGVT